MAGYAAMGVRLYARPTMRVPGGLFVTVAVSITPLMVYGLRRWLDLDVADPDDDNDGYTDAREIASGSDPKDPASIPPRVGMPAGVLNLLLED
jgi:hypothetical protein